MARKYESEQEKILPFYAPGQMPGDEALSEQEAAAMAQQEAQEAGVGPVASSASVAAEAGPSEPPKLQLSSRGLDEQGRSVEEWDYLNRYFRKFNKVNACCPSFGAVWGPSGPAAPAARVPS